MRIQGKYLINTDYITDSFSYEAVAFTSNGEDFIGIENKYEYKDSTAHYTLKYFREDGSEVIVGQRVSSTTTWNETVAYKTLNFPIEHKTSQAFGDFMSSRTKQLTMYLKPGSFKFNESLSSTGLTATTPPTKQYYDFKAVFTIDKYTVQVKKASIGYYNNNGSVYFTYFGYVGDVYNGDTLEAENDEFPIYWAGKDTTSGEEIIATGSWATTAFSGFEGVTNEVLQAITIDQENEVDIVYGNWFTSNNDYKKVAKTKISGSFSAIFWLPSNSTVISADVKCKFNFGFRRRDGEGVAFADGVILLKNDGEWRLFLSAEDPELLVFGSAYSIVSINFGEEEQEVPLEFYDYIITNFDSGVPWEMSAPKCPGERKWNQTLTTPLWIYPFYQQDSHMTSIIVCGTDHNISGLPAGVVMFGYSFNGKGELCFGPELLYCEGLGGWISGAEMVCNEELVPTAVDLTGVYRINPSEVGVEYGELEANVSSYYWYMSNTTTTNTPYELGKRRFKKNITPLKIPITPEDREQQQQLLYNYRFQLKEIERDEIEEETLFFASPVIEFSNGKIDMGSSIGVPQEPLPIGYAISIQTLGEREGATEEEIASFLGALSTEQSYTFVTYLEEVRDWILENTEECEQITIPKGRYVLFHDFASSWHEKMLEKWGKEDFSNGSFEQKFPFKAIVSGTEKDFESIYLNTYLSDSEPRTDLVLITKGDRSYWTIDSTNSTLCYYELAREIIISEDVKVDEDFYNHFVAHSNYKLVTGEDSITGWRKIKPGARPLNLSLNWDDQAGLEAFLEKYSVNMEPYGTSERYSSKSRDLQVCLHCTPFLAYNGASRVLLDGFGYGLNETSGAINKMVGWMSTSNSYYDFTQPQYYTAIDNKIAEAWLYEYSEPITGKVLPYGRYLFNKEINVPEGWTNQQLSFWVTSLGIEYQCSEIKYDAETNRLLGHIISPSDFEGVWGLGYDYAEKSWSGEEVRSWFIHNNVEVSDVVYNWVTSSSKRITGPKELLSDAAKIDYAFDVSVAENRIKAFYDYGIAIIPELKQMNSLEGHLVGFTPEITYEEGNASQLLAGGFTEQETQDLLVAKAAEGSQVKDIYILDPLNFEMAQWIDENTAETYTIWGCRKWKELSDIEVPEGGISETITFEAWEKGTNYYLGTKINWSAREGIPYINTIDTQNSTRAHWDANTWWDNSTDGSARVFNFGFKPRVVSKKFYDLLMAGSEAVSWNDYHATISGKWEWKNKLSHDAFQLQSDNCYTINGTKLYSILATALEEVGSVLVGITEQNLIVFYSEKTGWQDTPWTVEEFGAISGTDSEVNALSIALLSDKWRTFDLGSSSKHIGRQAYNYIIKNAKNLDSKTLTQLEVVQEEIGTSNGKAFQELSY